MPDEDDLMLDLDFDIAEFLQDEEEQADGADLAALNAANENLANDYISANRQYTRIRPDPNLDYSILDEFGISGYDVFFVGSAAGDMRLIIEAFLIHVKDDFYRNGIGTYDCIWRLRDGLGHFNEERVRRTATAWRAISREISSDRAPSSMPGRMCECRSIIQFSASTADHSKSSK